MNERFGARLCLGLFVASLLSLPIFPLFLPPFVGPVVSTACVTLAHIILGLFYYFRPTRDLRVGLCALLGAASWATWVWCYWEEYSAQMSLPNINIAGLIAPISTLLTILFLSSDNLKFGSTSRGGKRYFAVGVAFMVLVLVEVLWTFLFQEQNAEPAMSPDTASLVTVIILRAAPVILTVVTWAIALSTQDKKPRRLLIGAGTLALLSFFIPFVTAFSSVFAFAAWANTRVKH